MNAEFKSRATIAVLSLWLGGALLLAASVAPAAFAALPTRTLAGDVVGRVLPVVFYGGMALGILTNLLGPYSRVRRVLGAMVLFSCAIAQFQTIPEIARLRAAIGGPVDALSPTDPQRVRFGRLHALSIGWLALAMLAALTLLILSLLTFGRDQEKPGSFPHA